MAHWPASRVLPATIADFLVPAAIVGGGLGIIFLISTCLPAEVVRTVYGRPIHPSEGATVYLSAPGHRIEPTARPKIRLEDLRPLSTPIPKESINHDYFSAP